MGPVPLHFRVVETRCLLNNLVKGSLDMLMSPEKRSERGTYVPYLW